MTRFKCVRQCVNCKTKMEITEDNLNMRRNGWVLRGKKEFFVVCCTCQKRVHVSKQYLNNGIMNYVERNRNIIRPNVLSKEMDYSEVIHCDNCALNTVVNYDDVRVKRKKNYEIFNKPDKILFIKCSGVGCLADIELTLDERCY